VSSREISINGALIERVEVPPNGNVGITSFSIAPNLGGATLALGAVVNGKEINLFPQHDFNAFDSEIARDPNFPFQKVNSLLFPMSNRLLPTSCDARSSSLKFGESFFTEVMNTRVKMKANHGTEGGGNLHHLHGLTILTKAVSVEKTPGSITTRYSRFFEGAWTGEVELTVVQKIEENAFVYSAECKNVSDHPIPIGFGTHPYFQLPSGNPKAYWLSIPALSVAEIDDYRNVFPTGKFLPLGEKDRLNFKMSKRLPEGVIDNYFVLDPESDKEIQLDDLDSGIRVLFTPLTANIIGAQVYYPGHGSVIAVEFVTHLPDPREDLWANFPTGMQLLGPRENMKYGFQIQVQAIRG
jgi:aldose 1-epimerase